MHFYFAAKTAADTERIVADGFRGRDCVTVQLPYGDPAFVNQPGILVSTELDPRTRFAVEIEVSVNPTFLRRHELLSFVSGVRYYIFFISTTETGRLRRVSEKEIENARAAGIENWQHDPLIWFGKE
jgi:hypothetical protein